MSDEMKPELVYLVSDEMLERFAKSTTLQRLHWLEEMRTFTWNAATAGTRARWRAERDRDRGIETLIAPPLATTPAADSPES